MGLIKLRKKQIDACVSHIDHGLQILGIKSNHRFLEASEEDVIHKINTLSNHLIMENCAFEAGKNAEKMHEKAVKLMNIALRELKR